MNQGEPLVKETDWGLEIELEKGFVIDNANFETALNFIAKNCKLYNKKKVLIDATNAIRRTSALTMLDAVEKLPKSGLGFKMAVFTPEQYNDEISKAMETIAFNRGVALQYFGDKVTAMDWLLK